MAPASRPETEAPRTIQRQVAPFRLGHDEVRHGLPWRLMQNGPITKYWRREIFDEDIAALTHLGYEVPRFDCAEWISEARMHDALRVGLRLPDYTGKNFNALTDSLQEAPVSDETGLMVAFDNFTGAEGADVLLQVLANASRYWLLFGRIFGVLLRTDDPRYAGPEVGATQLQWNDREWRDASRSP